MINPRIIHSYSRSSHHFKNIHFKRNIQFDPLKLKGQPAPLLLKPRLDFKYICDNAENLRNIVQLRNMDVDVNNIVKHYHQYVELLHQRISLQTERNQISKKLKASRDQSLIERGKQIKNELKSIENDVDKKYAELMSYAITIPNNIHPDTPHEKGNVLKEIGVKPQFSFTPKSHVDIATELGIVDFDAGLRVSGHKFLFLKGDAALLELALVNWVTQELSKSGYLLTLPPDIVSLPLTEGCGFQPRSDHSQIYSIEDTELCLTATAEIPLAAQYHNAEITSDSLPIKLAAFSHCFRAETGGGGLRNRGLYRVHQFSKVEMFVLSKPESSEDILDDLVEKQIDIFSKLGLHFKVIDMPANDLGAPAYRKYDIECWFPSINDFGEISSASNCTDYQSRRLNIREKDIHGNLSYVHTLNATGIAVPRIIMAMLENFQMEDGRIKIPDVLVPYMGGKEYLGDRK